MGTFRTIRGLGQVPQERQFIPSRTVPESLRIGEVMRDGQSSIPGCVPYLPAAVPPLERPGRHSVRWSAATHAYRQPCQSIQAVL